MDAGRLLTDSGGACGATSELRGSSLDAKSLFKSGLKIWAKQKDLNWRKIPRLTTGVSPDSSSVYYLAPDNNRPSGGVRVIYRHVDVLNQLGINAAVLHTKSGFRASWFANDTKIAYATSTIINPKDILVLPEYSAPWFGSVPEQIRTVVFNQGPHYTFSALPGGHAAYGKLAGLEAILTVSEDGASLLRLAFPKIPIHIVRNVVDSTLFYPDFDFKNKIVSYVPSRRADELEQLLRVLKAQPEFVEGEWQLQALKGLDETDMASALKQSAIFISLSHRDGFGLPPAEAMACGAYVVGHPGGGGNEFFDPAYCTIAHDNTELATGLLDAMRMPGKLRHERSQLASQKIRARYSSEGLEQDLASFYGGLV